MRAVLSFALASIIATGPVSATSGVTTASVNFRSGPGTSYSSIRTLEAGSTVDIGECDESGNWCAVSAGGRKGFVSGRYLQESQEKSGDPKGWPRAYETGKGRMILYQPQFSEWSNFTTIEALVAAQFLETGKANPAFGVIALKGKTSYDEDAGEIVITDITGIVGRIACSGRWTASKWG